MRDGEVLLVTDVQNDFCPGGRLAVPKGDEAVPTINRLARDLRHAAAHGFDMILTEETCRAIDLAGSAAATKPPFATEG